MISERIAELECELWYTTPFRAWQWQANFEAYQFTWMVKEVRRVGGDAEMWGLIEDQLVQWAPTTTH